MSDLVDARFLQRPNRFVVDVRLADGREARAHLPDPGRLLDLLRPDARLRLRPAPAHTRRKTPFGVTLVRDGPRGPWISLEPARANHWIARWLREGRIEGFERVAALESEVRDGRHRFDFRLRRPDGSWVWIEVKAVALRRDGEGRFPDAPTLRGRAHLERLTKRAAAGDHAAVLFLTRADVPAVRAHASVDAAFASALEAARNAGVTVAAVAARFDRNARARFDGMRPVLPPLTDAAAPKRSSPHREARSRSADHLRGESDCAPTEPSGPTPPDPARPD